MPTKYQEKAEYYLVKGWFQSTGGIHEGTFYGACCYPSDPLTPIRVVIDGDMASLASQNAKSQNSIVYPQELREETKPDGEWFSDDRPPLKDITFQGLSITIENPKGTTRKGKSKDGHEWETKMKHDYGFLKRVDGADGEGVDVYVGPEKKAEFAHVVHQNNPKTKVFDEDKVMLGFSDAEAAREAYLAHYDNPDFFGSMTTIPMDTFKEAVNSRGDKFKWKSKKPQMGVKLEMCCSGGIADRPIALGEAKPVFPQRKSKTKKKKVVPPRGFKSPRLSTISQSGGRLGGNHL